MARRTDEMWRRGHCARASQPPCRAASLLAPSRVVSEGARGAGLGVWQFATARRPCTLSRVRTFGRSLVVCVCCVAVVGCRGSGATSSGGSASSTTAVDTTAHGGCARLPAGWTPDDMGRAVVPDDVRARAAVTVRVLAWQIDKDERPLEVDSALLWIFLESRKSGNSWELAHVYRHPDDPPSKWQMDSVTDVPFTGLQGYTSAPTHEQADTFFTATWWKFKPLDGFKPIGSEVCADAWKTAFHEAPWRSY